MRRKITGFAVAFGGVLVGSLLLGLPESTALHAAGLCVVLVGFIGGVLIDPEVS